MADLKHLQATELCFGGIGNTISARDFIYAAQPNWTFDGTNYGMG